MSFIQTRYNLTEADLGKYLGEALSKGGDYADLYFEYLSTTSASLDESIIKSASQGVSVGCGVRVISGEKTGYAYTNDLAPEKLIHAARTAAQIAAGPSQAKVADLDEPPRAHDLYPVVEAPSDVEFSQKVALLNAADTAARAYDKRIFQVEAGYQDSVRHVLVANSEGVIRSDTR